LEKHGSKFRHNIWGPDCLRIDQVAKLGRVSRQHVPSGLFKAFVVESKQDYDSCTMKFDPK
jgi:hypothetical protein